MGSELFLDKCEEWFNNRDFYEILHVNRDASSKESFKKAYYKLSLIVHPDRVEENKKIVATERFKVLSKIHSILQDEEKRKIYDDCGDFNEDELDWSAYWTSVITTDDLDKFKANYINSEEERLDLKTAYVNGKGDRDYMFNMVPFLDLENESRVTEIIQQMVDSQEVEEFALFFKEPKKKRDKRWEKYQKEAEEAKELAADFDALKKQIKQRGENQRSFFAHLEQKYCEPKAKKRKVSQTATKRTRSNKN